MIICKKLGPHLETGTANKAPQIHCLRGIKTLYLGIHMFLLPELPINTNILGHTAAVFRKIFLLGEGDATKLNRF